MRPDGAYRPSGTGWRLPPVRAQRAAAEPRHPLARAPGRRSTTCARGIHLRGYAQKQPGQEYKREARRTVWPVARHRGNEVTRTLLTVRIRRATKSRRPQSGSSGPARHQRAPTSPAETPTLQALGGGDCGGRRRRVRQPAKGPQRPALRRWQKYKHCRALTERRRGVPAPDGHSPTEVYPRRPSFRPRSCQGRALERHCASASPSRR